MNDTVPNRVEPMLDATATPVAQTGAIDQGVAAAPEPPPRRSALAGDDQGSRIEEKAARIEEKFARSEALLLRVESKMDSATGRMAEAARQADLSAVREQVTALTRVVRNLPGLTALVSVAIVTSLLTSAITVAVMRYGIPGLLPR